MLLLGAVYPQNPVVMTCFHLEVTLSPVEFGGSPPHLTLSLEPLLLSSAPSPASLGGGWRGPQEVVCSHLALGEATHLPEQCWDDLNAVNFFLSQGTAYFITEEAYGGDRNILICSSDCGSLSFTTGLC